MRAKCLVPALLVVLSLSVPPPVHADDAEVLPQGVWRTGIDAYVYLPMTRRFDENGKLEDVTADYNASLDGSVFPALGRIEAFFGLPAGSASLGRSELSFSMRQGSWSCCSPAA